MDFSYRFLQNILEKISEEIELRKQMVEKKKEEQEQKQIKSQKKITSLEKEWKEVYVSCLSL